MTIQHTEVAIKSIELQLVRAETCGCTEGYSRDGMQRMSNHLWLIQAYSVGFPVTEIQTIQIADGNICPKQQIPIYMIFPRLFTCPTLSSKNFKIGLPLCTLNEVLLPIPSFQNSK